MGLYKVEVLVIGAGQSGLAAGYFLKQEGVSCAILDSGSDIGEAWRTRYDSLVLFTPRRYSSLPGFAFKGDPDGYPTKDEMADYLREYSSQFSLPVFLNTTVFRLEKTPDGFHALTNRESIEAKYVIIATGPFQKPFIPRFANELSNNVYTIHSSEYRNPSQLEDGSVLVVGGGNSGAQIAVELAKEREVFISVGHHLKFLPLKLFGASIFWWMDKTGLLHAHRGTLVGSLLEKQKDPVFGRELQAILNQENVALKPKATDAKNDLVFFEDESVLHVQNIIWATGFKADFGWICIPRAFNHNWVPLHARGVSPVQGLYFLGLPWLNTRSSALVGGVGKDAEYLVNCIIAGAQFSK
ncbi:NAD(P)/FAD-dependent oxidoreductase [Paenibacillus sp. TRM 82003]|nr:NAD(P)/FAD-dependent oxidoreductase [Paenibacillus sp. TRM 82003]MCI3923409.1 NAD(P)/FAD-dependent oxidoreductase [Paenibacillus sp. TRM 82003]